MPAKKKDVPAMKTAARQPMKRKSISISCMHSAEVSGDGCGGGGGGCDEPLGVLGVGGGRRLPLQRTH